MTIDTTARMHRRLERHRRQKSDVAGNFVRNIRDTVERSHDQHGILEPRLLFGNSASKDGSGSSESGSKAKSGGSSGYDRSGSSSSDADGGDSTSSSSSNSNTGSDSNGNGNSNSSTDETNETADQSSTKSDKQTATTRPDIQTMPTSSKSSSSSSDTPNPLTDSSSTSASQSSSDSSSATKPDSSSSSSRTPKSSETPLPTSATSVTDANSLATSVRVITQSPSTIASASASPSTTNDGPGAGPIIGIVAGALAGLVLLAAATSYLVKWYSNRKSVDPYEANPFDRDEFRRQSAMIPDGFESVDGHQSISDHHNTYGGGSGYDDEMTMANSATAASLGAAAAAGAGAGSTYSSSHNEGGRPRPPTMFARHADAHGPSVGAVFNQPPAVPQMPSRAFGGGDPYSLAGVAGGMHNVSPYAHLDRNNSQRQYSPEQRFDNYSQNQQCGGVARKGSNGSSNGGAMVTSPESYGRRLDYGDDQNFETSGRPGTAEGRSGTPDIPNVQQTYALGDGTEDGHHEQQNHSPGSGRQSELDYYGNEGPQGNWSPPQMYSDHGRAQDDEYFQQMQQQYGDGMGRPESASASQGLQVRNLTGGAAAGHSGHYLPNPHAQSGGKSRAANSREDDDDAAYGGVY